MNLRQKVKHYKRLYEMYSPKKPFPVIYKSERELNHIKVKSAFTIGEEHYCYTVDDLKYHAVTQILDELRPFIIKNLKREYDKYSDNIIYTVDVWL